MPFSDILYLVIVAGGFAAFGIALAVVDWFENSHNRHPLN